MRTLALASLALFLAGCTVAYQLPDGAVPTAKVRFWAPGTESIYTGVAVYVLKAEDRCLGAEKLRILGHSQVGRIADAQILDIGMLKNAGSTYKKKTYIEVPVEAEKRINFIFASEGRECYMPMSFLPRTGRQYQVDYSNDATKCYGRVSELVEAKGVVMLIEEMSAKKNAQSCKNFWD